MSVPRARVLVTSPVAPLQAEPRAASEQVSQRLAGHLLMVLEDQPPWTRARGGDGYDGWVHHGYVRAVHPGEEPAIAAGRLSLGCTVRHHGRRRSLPLGARLDAAAVVETGGAVEPHEVPERFPRSAASIVRSATELFEGTSYQWGGITPWGADCSGFVQSCLGLHGIPVPRDSRHQAEMGVDTGVDLGSLRAADLLFFSDAPDRPITHVAMALGGARIVHVALGRGGHAVESLDRRDDPYVAGLVERFRFARRLDL